MSDKRRNSRIARCSAVDRLGARCKETLGVRNTSGLCVVHRNVGKHGQQDPLGRVRAS